MKTNTLFLFILAAYAAVLLSCTECSLEGTKNRCITIISYNVENLFDDVDNGSEYRSYDPGEGVWNLELYHTKLSRISEVIENSVNGGPDILALQEIENENVLSALKDAYLKGMGYIYSVMAPAEGSAVNSAVLSRIPVTGFKAHSISINGDYPGRNILEVNFDYDGRLLTLFINHWKSKSGGAFETENKRLESASLIRRRLLELYGGNPLEDIIVLGDLNENIDEYLRTGKSYQTALMPDSENIDGSFSSKSLVITEKTGSSRSSAEEVVLYSPWSDSGYKGSYVYKDSWETIDHFLLNSALFDNTGFSFGSFEPVMKDFMLNDDGYPVRWSSETGTGYSDHLPVMLILNICRMEQSVPP